MTEPMLDLEGLTTAGPVPVDQHQQPVLTVNIPGAPRGQGSMTLWQDKRTGGTRAKYPKDVVAHRNLVVSVLADAWEGRPRIDGPVMVKAIFCLPRPQAHVLPANRRRPNPVLRVDAPIWHTGHRDDVDKMARLVGDALTVAGVVVDDGFIARWIIQKQYAPLNSAGYTWLDVYRLPERTQP